jgi:hypothetical protein
MVKLASASAPGPAWRPRDSRAVAPRVNRSEAAMCPGKAAGGNFVADFQIGEWAVPVWLTMPLARLVILARSPTRNDLTQCPTFFQVGKF